MRQMKDKWGLYKRSGVRVESREKVSSKQRMAFAKGLWWRRAHSGISMGFGIVGYKGLGWGLGRLGGCGGAKARPRARSWSASRPGYPDGNAEPLKVSPRRVM